MVTFGRPAGDRRSYLQWKEGGLPPQVVFEVLSLSNSDDEFDDKLAFYDRHGVEEYYFIDPYDQLAKGYVRRSRGLSQVRKILGFASPRLGTRFERRDGELVLLTPEGRPFQSRQERVLELQGESRRAEAALRAERRLSRAEAKRAEAEARRADAAEERAARVAAKLRELGIDPDAI